MDQNSEGKCNECKKTFVDVITVRGKPIKIKKCQACFDKSSKCNEMGNRPRNCKKPSSTDNRDAESDKDKSVNKDESESNKRSHTKSYLRKSGDKAYGVDLK